MKKFIKVSLVTLLCVTANASTYDEIEGASNGAGAMPVASILLEERILGTPLTIEVIPFEENDEVENVQEPVGPSRHGSELRSFFND
jgi:hypothetical protein